MKEEHTEYIKQETEGQTYAEERKQSGEHKVNTDTVIDQHQREERRNRHLMSTTENTQKKKFQI